MALLFKTQFLALLCIIGDGLSLVGRRVPSVLAQFFANCDIATPRTQEWATDDQCGCPFEPACSECVEDVTDNSVTISCSSACGYCSNSTPFFCGQFGITRGFKDELFDVGGSFYTFTYEINTYEWIYTQGSNGSLVYSFAPYLHQSCEIYVNDEPCASCELFECTYGGYEPNIDCTNLQPGATAVACTERAFGGLVSLNESALADDGILLPLAIPYLGCYAGLVVLETDGTTTTMNPGSTLPLTQQPTTMTTGPPETTTATPMATLTTTTTPTIAPMSTGNVTPAPSSTTGTKSPATMDLTESPSKTNMTVDEPVNPAAPVAPPMMMMLPNSTEGPVTSPSASPPMNAPAMAPSPASLEMPSDTHTMILTVLWTLAFVGLAFSSV